MGNIIADRVKAAQLTKSQRVIAEYFIQNQDRIGNLSSLDVAKEIGVSDASIIRFSRAIGFKGYADLKGRIYEMLVENAYGGLSLSERLSKNSEKYNGAFGPLQFQQLMQQNADSVFRNNHTEDFDLVAENVISAQSRYVIGMRGCRGIAAQFGYILSSMLPHVYTLTESMEPPLYGLQDISDRDTLVMFAHSRFYKADLNCLELAKKRGAKICLVTNDITGPLSPYADVILMAETANVSFYHSTLATDLVGEYILNLISRRVDVKARINEWDQITKTQRL